MQIESVILRPSASALANGAFSSTPDTPVPESGETLGDYLRRTTLGGSDPYAAINILGSLIGGGELEISFRTGDELLEKVISGGEDAEALCRERPHMWNILCYEKEWETYPEYNDFLEPSSPVFHKKLFQWKVYESLIKSAFPSLAAGDLKVLDVGGGVGRAALPLSGMGNSVTITDASPLALKTAWKHLSAVNAKGYDLAWTDAADLSMFEENSFDAGIALEVFCYHSEPEKCLKELAKKVKPGGPIFFSVENLAGAMLADRSLNATNILAVIASRQLEVENEIFVKYLSRDELRRAAESAGIKNIEIVGAQYVADGPAGLFVPNSYYGKSKKAARLRLLEDALRELNSPAFPPRAWLVSGTVD